MKHDPLKTTPPRTLPETPSNTTIAPASLPLNSEPPKGAKPRFSSKLRMLRSLMYVMLLLSAASAFFSREPLWAAARGGSLPIWAPMLPILTFTIFVLIYTIDRWLLVYRRRYPFSLAILQISFAVIFLSFLWPQQAQEFREFRQKENFNDDALSLLDNRNPKVRALACEVLRYREQTNIPLNKLQDLASKDQVSSVRNQCQLTLDELLEKQQGEHSEEPPADMLQDPDTSPEDTPTPTN